MNVNDWTKRDGKDTPCHVKIALLSRLLPLSSIPEHPSSRQESSPDSCSSARMEKSRAQCEKSRDLESQAPTCLDATVPRNQATAESLASEGSCRSQSSSSVLAKLKVWKPSKELIYNAILGTSDGMTVPFAVTASLAGVADARLVMLAGLSELIAGAVSMAAGGVLGARSDV